MSVLLTHLMAMGTCFGSSFPFSAPSLVFSTLRAKTTLNGADVFSRHGWLAGLSVAACDLACNDLEMALGSYPLQPHGALTGIRRILGRLLTQSLLNRNKWSDGSREAVQHVDVEVGWVWGFSPVPCMYL